MRVLPSKRRGTVDSQSFHFLYKYFVDLLFPPRCVECHSVGRSICGKCYPLIEWIGVPICPVCGQPLGKSVRHTCVDPHLLQWVRSAAVFSGPMRRAIHALKYSSDRTLASFLVDISFAHFAPVTLDFDRIVPVPLGRIREQKRGYNQSVLLAEALSLKTLIPVDTKCLIRSRETKSQVGLSHDERRQNVDRAFSATSVTDRKVIIVDDVCTTGATLQSCAASLIEAGARSVAGWTLARAVLPGMDLHSQLVGGKDDHQDSYQHIGNGNDTSFERVCGEETS
jgi:ComF family protein